jgi:hypothetical protein
MSKPKPTVTIDQAFQEFLAEQEARLSPTTISKYTSILGLLRSCLESYWPGHGQKEYDRITKAGGTYCGTYGPQEILGGLSEFLGYFMPRKVAAGKETMKAAGTVTKMLVKWMAAKGYIEDQEDLERAEERAASAARDLPASQEVAAILEAYLDEYSPERYSQEIEDHFTVTRVEPRKLWLESLMSDSRKIGPVPVPQEVSDRCKVGWDISGILAKTSKGWRLLEVWNVTP